MDFNLEVEKFIQYHRSAGGQIHFVIWQKSAQIPQGEFKAQWEEFEKANSELTADELTATIDSLNASWNTWIYCRTNIEVPDDQVLVPRVMMDKLIKRLKSVMQSKDQLNKLIGNQC